MQPNRNVLQEIEWEMNVYPVWPVAVWTNDTFTRLLKRLHFHWFIFHQWCIDGFDLICNVWIKTLHLSIIYIILPLSVAPVSKTEPNHKCKISRSTVKVKFFLVNLFNCLKNYLLRSDCKKKKKNVPTSKSQDCLFTQSCVIKQSSVL